MFRKGLAVAVILLFIGMCVVPSTAVQELREKPSPISFDGNTLYVGGSGPGNYTSIREAIHNASSGDTVFVYDDSSPYYENLVINKAINLIGENRDTTIIDGRKIDNVIGVISHQVTISGFTIQNSSDKYWWEAGIYILNTYDMNIRGNNIISNNIGLYSESGYSIICDNILENSKSYGIYLFDFYNSTISDNHIISNNKGINFDNFCFNNIVSGNTITSNDDYGISLLPNTFDTKITENIISSNNACGVFIAYRSNGNSVVKNHISNNGLGINCGGDGNIIRENNFIDNERQEYESFGERNNWDSNYWDNWIGLKNLIFQNFPKIIWGGFIFSFLPCGFDWNPAQEPYDIGV